MDYVSGGMGVSAWERVIVYDCAWRRRGLKSTSIGVKVIVRELSAWVQRDVGWIESKAWRRAWVGGERCAAAVALSWGRQYSTAVRNR
jgi:hypothetical protein